MKNICDTLPSKRQNTWKLDETSWGWAVPSSVEVKVWGLVKALSLIFENGNVEEVWSQRGFKLRMLLDENIEVEEVLDD